MNILLTIDSKSNGSDLKSELKKIPGVRIIGLTENSIEVLYALIQNQVDLMIIDNSLKSLSAKDCYGMVQKLNIPVKILLLVDAEEEFMLVENPDCFDGYLLRNSNVEDIVAGIESAKNIQRKIITEPDDIYMSQVAS
jgi:DNA-binding NarL/FixJ family response regulator